MHESIARLAGAAALLVALSPATLAGCGSRSQPDQHDAAVPVDPATELEVCARLRDAAPAAFEPEVHARLIAACDFIADVPDLAYQELAAAGFSDEEAAYFLLTVVAPAMTDVVAQELVPDWDSFGEIPEEDRAVVETSP